MTISKAHWDTEGDSVRLSMPFSKVDKERRIVSGFASLDNLDKQNDIVTAEASMSAFAKFRGNIREMHQPLAVGKMVDFKAEKYFDPESKKFYNGVYVSAYVSKGAQDTWEKVLDGTLTGFSIGGRMNKWDDGYDEKSDSQIRIIKEYDLVELSLVDSPANQFANIMSVEKVDGMDVIKGAETTLENVFWDSESGLVMTSENEVEYSPVSGNAMKNIGFVEKTDNEKTDMIKFLVDSAKGINTSKINKEVNPMTETTEVVSEIVEKSDAVVEDVQVAPEADAKADTAEAEDESTEKAMKPHADEETPAEDAGETPADEEAEDKKPASKSDEVIVESVETVSKAVAEINNQLTSAFSDLVTTVKSLQEQVATLNKSLDSVRADVQGAKDEFNEFGKRVDAVEADTAFRKSGDLGEIIQEQPVMVEKSLWGGRFLKTADLLN
jgi:outer membrane murein-binding lipoprotein Lpp